MPLTFESMSHGVIAFGFFNIETDLLLLQNTFFFADDFCRCVAQAASMRGAVETDWDGYRIPEPSQVGDLMGAIHKIRFTGFIGEVYRKYPFPDAPEDFRQKTEGFKTRDVIEPMILNYGEQEKICFTADEGGGEAFIGAYRFDRRVFQQLILYVWRGGYPRWKHEKRPGYVERMKSAIESGPKSGLFYDIRFSPEST